MRNVQSDEFLWSKAWISKSRAILRRDGYIDQYILKTTGRREPATLVHHILPREEFPQYAMEDWNLISLSRHTHNKIIHTFTGKLTKEGKKLMYETAFKNDIRLQEKTLVVGLPGSGKSTWVREALGMDGIAYDLDAIAGAFRLREPHQERHTGSRRMANALMKAFAQRAFTYSPRVFIIRTAPAVDEVAEIKPDRMVICTGVYDIRRRNDFADYDRLAMEKRIEDAKKWCELNSVPVILIPARV